MTYHPHLDDFLPLHSAEPMAENALTLENLERNPAKEAWLATSRFAHELAPIIKRLHESDITRMSAERFLRTNADKASNEMLLADNLLQAALETCEECTNINRT